WYFPFTTMVTPLAYFMFTRTGTQSMNAIDANQALFGYRQVKPVDTVLVRAGLEGFLMTLIVIILCIGGGLFGLDIVPADPLLALAAFCGLWLTGLGFGLIMSVSSELIPEIGKFIDLFMTPLYFFSGVLFPVSIVPHPYYDWLLLNPLIHGLEAVRLAFAPDYRVIPELSISYLYGFALVTIFFGLALHNRFAARLVTQ
ncbi:MAG: ABC transporter permease, partial [Gallionella sp.]